jgi:hypothetical protein
MQSLEQMLKRCVRYSTGQISKPIRTNDGYVKWYSLLPTVCKIEAYSSGFQAVLAFRELHRRVPPQNGVMTFSSTFTGRIKLTCRIAFLWSFFFKKKAIRPTVVQLIPLVLAVSLSPTKYFCNYKVVQIWPGLIAACLHTNHIWITLKLLNTVDFFVV